MSAGYGGGFGAGGGGGGYGGGGSGGGGGGGGQLYVSNVCSLSTTPALLIYGTHMLTVVLAPLHHRMAGTKGPLSPSRYAKSARFAIQVWLMAC